MIDKNLLSRTSGIRLIAIEILIMILMNMIIFITGEHTNIQPFIHSS
jgi:hypothetical protein